MILSVLLQAGLVINEICASNIDGTLSPATNFDSWIELYNPSDTEIDLRGFCLSDDVHQWQMPDVIGAVAAGGFKVLWLGSADIDPRQAPFSLSCDGSFITLNDADGQLVDEVFYPEALSRTAWARTTDGGSEWQLTSQPTPGSSNTTSAFAEERLEPPVVNTGSCTFTTDFNIRAQIPQGCTLRYTTNGALPTEQSEVSANGRFTVSSTTNYRFRLFREGFLPSVPVTRSYIKTEPTSLPIVSVVGDPRYFTDPQIGIAVKGTNGIAGYGRSDVCNWNRDWERPVNFSYILPDGTMAFNQDVEVSISGNATRRDNPKSLKLKSGKEFDGQNDLCYPFFQQKPYLRNKTVVLRTGGNDNVDGSGGSQYKAGRFRDAAIQTVLQRAGIDLDLQSYQPVVRYVNGVRDGVINLREPSNKKYVASNWGYDDDAIDFFEVDIYRNMTFNVGNDAVLERIFSLARHANLTVNYNTIAQLLDIDEYCNYMAMQLYLCSKDWPHNNIKGFRCWDDGGRFRIITYDLDLILRVDNPFTTFASEQWYHFTDATTGQQQSQEQEIKFVTLFLNMLQNMQFRRQFIDTYSMMAGSIFDYSRTEAILNELADRVRPEMQRDGMSPDGSLRFLLDNLNGHADRMMECLRTFEPMQLDDTDHFHVTLSSNTPGARLFVNDVEIPYAQFSGQLFAPARVKALAPGGYRFLGWRLNGASAYASKQPLITIPAQDNQHIEACFRLLTDEERKAENISPIRINEVSAQNDMAVNDLWKRADWVELYNTTDEDINLAGLYLSDNSDNPYRHKLEGGIIPAHGYYIIWCDKQGDSSSQPEHHAPFKLAAEGGYVSITADDGSWQDMLCYEYHGGDESVARFPDGADAVYHIVHPTIDAPNRLSSFDVEVQQSVYTGIVEITQNDQTANPQNGQTTIYNLNGQRVTRSARGIVISNGRKILKTE